MPVMDVSGGSDTDTTGARDRQLVAVNEVAAATSQARTVQEISQLLVSIFLEAIPGIDTTAILLCERHRLRLFATAGLARVSDASTSFAVGEDFAGRIAAERRPLALDAAALERAAPGGAPHRRLRALYGVPLAVGDSLLGVAYVGSLTVPAIGELERRLFDRVAEHAALGISYHALRAEREQGLAERAAFFTAAPAGIAMVDEELRFVQVNEAFAVMSGRTAGALLSHPVTGVVPATSAPSIVALLRRVLERGETASELPFEFADQPQPRALLAACFPIRRPSGEPLAAALILTDITAHKRMEDELRERELHFRMMADHIPQLAWIADAQGALVWLNRRWFEFVRLPPQEAVGSAWKRAVHPDHLARVLEGIARSIATGEPWEDTFPIRAGDGMYRWFLSRATPIRDDRGQVINWFGTSTDFTEQWLLDQSTAYLSESIEPSVTLPKISRLAIPTLADVCFLDLLEEGVIRRAAWAHADPGRDRARQGGPVGVPPPVTASSHPVVRAITTGEVVFVPEVDPHAAHRESGTTLQELLEIPGLTSVMVVPMTAGDRRLGALTFAYTTASRRHHTAGQRRAAEELARRAAIAIDNARHYDEARRAVRTRERVLAIVSHDLRNPLGTIELSLTRLQQQVSDPAVTRHVDIVRRATRRMETLISDLLDMASIQAGKLALTCAPVRATDLLDELVESQAPLAHDQGLALELESGLRDETIWGDRHRLLQVLANLVGNAIKFCRAGDRITIRATAAPTQLVLEIADTGPGIPAEALPHLFEAYWSEDAGRKRSTGLGLHIAKGIVDAHHGQLSVQSTPGQGSVFRVVLPRGDAVERAGAATPASSAARERDGDVRVGPGPHAA